MELATGVCLNGGMPGGASADNHLLDHMERCAARVVSEAKDGHGSGFFIDADLVITCEHVAGPVGTNVTVTGAVGQPERSGAVIAASPEAELDYAVIRLEPQTGTNSRHQNAVPLQTEGLHAVDNGYLGGWGKIAGDVFDDAIEPGYQRPPINWTTAEDNGVVEHLLIDAGPGIERGFSGGPIVSAQSRQVVGMIVVDRVQGKGLKGGRALPIASIAIEVQEVKRCCLRRPRSVLDWSVAVEQALDPMRVAMQLTLSGTPARWNVQLDEDQATPVGATELGEDVSHAVFGWASGANPATKEDIDRCGTLLGRALDPTDLSERLAALVGQDAKTTCWLDLQFDDKTFEDVPWELSRLGRLTPTIAAHDQLVMRRTSTHQPPSQVELSPKPPALIVLPLLRETKEGDDARRAYERTFLNPGRAIQPVLREALNFDEVDGLLSDNKYDILHYVGSTTGPDGLLLFGHHDEYQLSDVATLAGDNGARLLVVQIRSHDPGSGMGGSHRLGGKASPLRPSLVSELLSGSLEAIVFTRQPLPDTPLNHFSRVMYEELNKGVTVEQAVQVARAGVSRAESRWPGAHAGFVVVSARSRGIQLVPTSSDSGAHTKDSAQIYATSDTASDTNDLGVAKDVIAVVSS